MRVDFERDDGARDSHVVRVVEWDAQAGTSVWALADVRANRAKGRPGLTRKQREER